MAPHATAPKKEVVAEVQAAAPQLEKVKWSSSPNMRKLYFYCIILSVCSATTGYDGYAENVQDALRNCPC